LRSPAEPVAAVVSEEIGRPLGVRDEQVRVPVAVVVEHERAGAGGGTAHGDHGEGAVAVVAQEPVGRAVLRDEDVVVPVDVQVGVEREAGIADVVVQARLRRHVLEGPVLLSSVESLLSLAVEIEVEDRVAVVVEEEAGSRREFGAAELEAALVREERSREVEVEIAVAVDVAQADRLGRARDGVGLELGRGSLFPRKRLGRGSGPGIAPDGEGVGADLVIRLRGEQVGLLRPADALPGFQRLLGLVRASEHGQAPEAGVVGGGEVAVELDRLVIEAHRLLVVALVELRPSHPVVDRLVRLRHRFQVDERVLRLAAALQDQEPGQEAGVRVVRLLLGELQDDAQGLVEQVLPGHVVRGGVEKRDRPVHLGVAPVRRQADRLRERLARVRVAERLEQADAATHRRGGGGLPLLRRGRRAAARDQPHGQRQGDDQCGEEESISRGDPCGHALRPFVGAGTSRRGRRRILPRACRCRGGRRRSCR
jgi:hypothetical protein